jgi:hypothetical protein
VLTTNQSGGYADLDAPSDDPQWSRENGKTGDGVTEGPRMVESGISIFAPAKLLFLGTSAGNYAICSQAQTYNTFEVPYGDLVKGASFCIKTSAGHIALLTTTKEASAQEVDFNVTVWQKPTG